MEQEKIGNFIKELREEKNWSQEYLGEKIHCDRTKINKIENGKRAVNLEDMILLSKIFDISLEELVSGERKNKKNEKSIDITFKEYLKSQRTKSKKIRILTIFFAVLCLISFSLLTIFYFLQNYKTVRIYSIKGSSENYNIYDGLLILTKEKIYLKIENIDPKVDEISVYVEEDDKTFQIYKGDPDIILKDLYGYEALISYDDFVNSKQKIFVVIDGERIDLEFKEEYVNNKFIYTKEQKIGPPVTEYTESEIPEKIKETFQCDDSGCSLAIDDELLIYNEGILAIYNDESCYIYNLNNNYFSYENNNDSSDEFNVKFDDDKIICDDKDCERKQKIYDEFYKSYVLKYLK